MRPYFPVGLDLVDRLVLVVGGNREAAIRAEALVEAGARVKVVWPTAGDELRALTTQSDVHLREREFTEGELSGARIVVLTEPDPGLSERLHALGPKYGYLFCAIDRPEHSDWVHLATFPVGPVRFSLTSGGGAPGLLRRLREDLAAGLGPRFARFASRLVARREARKREDRRAATARDLEGFSLEVRVIYPSWEAEEE